MKILLLLFIVGYAIMLLKLVFHGVIALSLPENEDREDA
jgi:hypothetical protein